MEEYDVTSGSWKEGARLKEERGRFDAAVVDEKVYAIAGSNGVNDMKSCEVYDRKVRGGSYDEHFFIYSEI